MQTTLDSFVVVKRCSPKEGKLKPNDEKATPVMDDCAEFPDVASSSNTSTTGNGTNEKNDVHPVAAAFKQKHAEMIRIVPENNQKQRKSSDDSFSSIDNAKQNIVTAYSVESKESSLSSSYAALPEHLKEDELSGNANLKDDDDPYLIKRRFVDNQRLMFSTALREITQGEKRSCWFWFVLPTEPYIVNGMERGSAMNKRYALRGDEEAIAYLQCEVVEGVNLRQNYIDILRAIEKQLKQGNTMQWLFGPLDDVKALSSFRLFERIATKMEDKELRDLCSTVLDLTKKKKNKFKRRFV